MPRHFPSTGPPPQRISNMIIELFFYLNVKRLDLRKAGKLLDQAKAKDKPMRKLYTLVAVLEIASEIMVVSKIHLNTSMSAPPKSGQFNLSSALSSPAESIRHQRYQCGGGNSRESAWRTQISMQRRRSIGTTLNTLFCHVGAHSFL
jgi:hypothetical protein